MVKTWDLMNHLSEHKKIIRVGMYSHTESCEIDGKTMYKTKPHGNREKQLQVAEKINTTCWASRNIIVIRRKAK